MVLRRRAFGQGSNVGGTRRTRERIGNRVALGRPGELTWARLWRNVSCLMTDDLPGAPVSFSSFALPRFPVLAALWVSACAFPASAATWVYVSNADSQEVSVLALDRSAGRLQPVGTVPVGGTVMPLAVSPDKRFLYAALRSQPFRVVSFSIDGATGRLNKLGESSLADNMANIDVDVSGKWLFAASYPGHKITVNGIDAKGVVGAVQQVIPTGPNAHAIHADAHNRHVLSTSL